MGFLWKLIIRTNVFFEVIPPLFRMTVDHISCSGVLHRLRKCQCLSLQHRLNLRAESLGKSCQYGSFILFLFFILFFFSVRTVFSFKKKMRQKNLCVLEVHSLQSEKYDLGQVFQVSMIGRCLGYSH